METHPPWHVASNCTKHMPSKIESCHPDSTSCARSESCLHVIYWEPCLRKIFISYPIKVIGNQIRITLTRIETRLKLHIKLDKPCQSQCNQHWPAPLNAHPSPATAHHLYNYWSVSLPQRCTHQRLQGPHQRFESHPL